MKKSSGTVKSASFLSLNVFYSTTPKIKQHKPPAYFWKVAFRSFYMSTINIINWPNGWVKYLFLILSLDITQKYIKGIKKNHPVLKAKFNSRIGKSQKGFYSWCLLDLSAPASCLSNLQQSKSLMLWWGFPAVYIKRKTGRVGAEGVLFWSMRAQSTATAHMLFF